MEKMFYKLQEEDTYHKDYRAIDITKDFDTDFIIRSEILAQGFDGNVICEDVGYGRICVVFVDKLVEAIEECLKDCEVVQYYRVRMGNILFKEVLAELKNRGIGVDTNWRFMRIETFEKKKAERRAKLKNRKAFFDVVANCGKTNRDLISHWKQLIIEMNDWGKKNKLPIRGDSKSMQEWHFHEVIALAKTMGFETKYSGLCAKMVRSPKRYAVKCVDN